MKNLKFWWKPNFLSDNFEVKVNNITDAFICHEVCTSLDLGTTLSNVVQMFPKKESFICRISDKYKEYRRQYSINSSHLITDNVNGVEEFCADENEWIDWVGGENLESLNDMISWNETADVIQIIAAIDAQN